MDYLLVVDDTGLNRQNMGTECLKQKRKTVCGVLMPVNEIANLSAEVAFQIKDLKELYNAEEFHFTDIYNKQKGFEDLEKADIISMINVFAEIVDVYDLKIITQSITDDLIAQKTELFSTMDSIIKNLKFKDSKDEGYALILDIIMAKKYLKEHGNKDDKIVDVICDGGLRKPGTDLIIDGLYDNGLPLHFCDSKVNLLLQIADFCAWSRNRTDMILNKSQNKEMKDIDKLVLNSLSIIAKNYVNLTSVKTNINNGINIDYFYNAITKQKEKQ